MIIYTVSTTPKTADYTPATFLDTSDGIYCEQPGNGFFKHPTITTPEKLRAHLIKLSLEGFKIDQIIVEPGKEV